MTHISQPTGWLMAMAATWAVAALAGCDRPAVSQPPTTDSTATETQSPAVRPVAREEANATAEPSADVQPAAHQEAAAAETPKAIEAAAAETPKAIEAPATAAAPSAGDGPPRRSAIRPKADRGATADGVQKITFDDLILGMQADMVFRPWMLESETNGGRAKDLDGKPVRLTGVMHGGVESVKKNKEFVLLRNKECKFGPGGQADHLAKIFMKEGKTVSYTDDTIYVEGTLRIKPSMGEDGNTWSIYEIEGAEVK